MPNSTDPPRILIVDDVKNNVLLMEMLLKKHGYIPISAYSGAEALEKIEQNDIDVVVMDVMMPEMDGFEATRHIKANEKSKHIPVILLTAQRRNLTDIVTGLDSGADEYATKPIDEKELTAKLRALLRIKELYDQLNDANTRLRELDQLKNDLTHMIVHDLRNPLTGILGHLQLLKMTELSAEQSNTLDNALQNAEQLLGMITDLLDISKMEEGKLMLKTSPIIFEDVVQVALRQVQVLVEEKGINLQIAINETLPVIIADYDKLLRVMVNLLSNAIKFTPPAGHIEIRANVVDTTTIQVSVSDTGEGIPENYLDRIFDKFIQVESRKAGRNLSTGLGLTFCKLVLEAHQGKIWVESALGKGSTFYFSLPLQTER